MFRIRSAYSYCREPGRLQESGCPPVLAQRGGGERIKSGKAGMLDCLPDELTAKPAALPSVINGDRNFALVGIVSAQHIPDHADGGRLVQRQRYVCHVSLPVYPRHLVEQPLAEPWYRREETEVAGPWRQIHDRSVINRTVGRAEGSNTNDVLVMEY